MSTTIPFDTTTVCIAGRWRAGSSGQTLALHNPSDGSVLAHIARGNAQDVDDAVQAAQAALAHAEPLSGGANKVH
jgi:aldehyde dehydrogenase (NAD+)